MQGMRLQLDDTQTGSLAVYWPSYAGRQQVH
jgi:hypothetical protein